MLRLDATDRRRLVVPAVFTVIALPAIWLFARNQPQDGTATPSVAAAAGVVAPAAAAQSPETSSDLFGSVGPIFVNGPTTPPKAAVVPIVVPASVANHSLDGMATYKTGIDPQSTSCSAARAPFGARLTVTNLDNGRPIQCLNKIPPKIFGKGIEIQLPTTLFEQIGQLVDAPLHVRITWDAG